MGKPPPRRPNSRNTRRNLDEQRLLASQRDSDQEEENEESDQETSAATRKRPVVQKLVPKKLRIVAGEMRGRKIQYNGDPATRPMKERTRESVFSLLGGYLNDYFAVDLFGGTGILAMESVSRGARGGVIFELSRPAVANIVDNLRLLHLENCIAVHNIDTLRWIRSVEQNTRTWPRDCPWVIFSCPPYRLWNEQGDRLLPGLEQLLRISPIGSQMVCETESSFDISGQVPTLQWDVRKYKPAHVAIARNTPDA